MARKKKQSEGNAQLKKKQQQLEEYSRQTLNHIALTNIDSKTGQVFFNSAICSVYKFSMTSNSWEKLSVLGTLFIYSRRVAPEDETDPYPYALIILNRTSPENFSLGLIPQNVSYYTNAGVQKDSNDIPEMNSSLEDSFIMVSASDGQMYGLWLFDEKDRDPALSLINWCLHESGDQVAQKAN